MTMFKDFYLNIELVDKYAKMPTRGTDDSAGLDFYTPVDFHINPGEDALIPLGIKTEFPKGYALIMKEKSGLATKKKLEILACVIDADYRGIVHAHLHNTSKTEAAFFHSGEKVCQGIIVPIWTGTPKMVEFIDEATQRGTLGFGSTGK
jgi:dUTP pyrophosphatase